MIKNTKIQQRNRNRGFLSHLRLFFSPPIASTRWIFHTVVNAAELRVFFRFYDLLIERFGLCDLQLFRGFSGKFRLYFSELFSQTNVSKKLFESIAEVKANRDTVIDFFFLSSRVLLDFVMRKQHRGTTFEMLYMPFFLLVVFSSVLQHCSRHAVSTKSATHLLHGLAFATSCIVHHQLLSCHFSG